MPTRSDPILECETREQLAELLEVSVPTLTYFAYGSGKKYTNFTIPKKSGGTRAILAPVDGLVEIQRKLASHLVKLYPNLVHVHGFVNGRSIVTNATPHLNKREVLNIDLKDFFPTITASRIIGLLKARPFNFNNKIASTIAGLTCYKGSLPQGAPTSPVLSNMICLRMDKALWLLCKQKRIAYSRYADDITFSARKALPASIATLDDKDGSITLGAELMDIIANNYFEINPKKTRISLHNQAKYVTGVKVNLLPNLPRKYVRQLRSMLHAWETWGLKAAQKEFTDEYNGGDRDFVSVVRGKLAHLKNIKTDGDLTYGRLYNRFIKLEGLGRPPIPVTEIEKLHSRVYVIQSGQEQGTGFLLNSKWFLTCGHVVPPGTTDVNYFTYEKWIPLDQERSSPNEESRSPKDEFDMIELSFDRGNQDMLSKSFKLAPGDFNVEVGMEFRAVGFPSYRSGSTPHVMPIKVAAINQNGSYMHAYVGQKMTGGFSGSPVLDDHNRVVGVIQRGEKGSSVDNTFLPIQELRRYLSSLDG